MNLGMENATRISIDIHGQNSKHQDKPVRNIIKEEGRWEQMDERQLQKSQNF